MFVYLVYLFVMILDSIIGLKEDFDVELTQLLSIIGSIIITIPCLLLSRRFFAAKIIMILLVASTMLRGCELDDQDNPQTPTKIEGSGDPGATYTSL